MLYPLSYGDAGRDYPQEGRFAEKYLEDRSAYAAGSAKCGSSSDGAVWTKSLFTLRLSRAWNSWSRPSMIAPLISLGAAKCQRACG